MINIHTRYSNTVFRKLGFYSSGQIFRLLESAPESDFTDNSLASKEIFIGNLARLITNIEQTGSALQSAREMLAPGSIAENWFPGEYGPLRQSYIEERKKLRKELELINLLFKTK